MLLYKNFDVFVKNYDMFLKNLVSIVEVFTYTVSIVIISISIVKSIINYIQEYNYTTNAFFDTRLILGQSISLALTFVLSVEVLRLFYVKSYKQLIIIATLVILKLFISYFLDIEIKTTPTNLLNYSTNKSAN